MKLYVALVEDDRENWFRESRFFANRHKAEDYLEDVRENTAATDSSHRHYTVYRLYGEVYTEIEGVGE